MVINFSIEPQTCAKICVEITTTKYSQTTNAITATIPAKTVLLELTVLFVMQKMIIESSSMVFLVNAWKITMKILSQLSANTALTNFPTVWIAFTTPHIKQQMLLAGPFSSGAFNVSHNTI